MSQKGSSSKIGDDEEILEEKKRLAELSAQKQQLLQMAALEDKLVELERQQRELNRELELVKLDTELQLSKSKIDIHDQGR